MADTFPGTIKPDRITDVEHEFNTTVKRFEKSRNKQRFANQKSPTKRYRLEWNMMTLAEMDILKAHFDDRQGAFKAFNFSDSRLDATILVWFKDDTIRFSKFNHYFTDVSVEIET